MPFLFNFFICDMIFGNFHEGFKTANYFIKIQIKG